MHVGEVFADLAERLYHLELPLPPGEHRRHADQPVLPGNAKLVVNPVGPVPGFETIQINPVPNHGDLRTSMGERGEGSGTFPAPGGLRFTGASRSPLPAPLVASRSLLPAPPSLTHGLAIGDQVIGYPPRQELPHPPGSRRRELVQVPHHRMQPGHSCGQMGLERHRVDHLGVSYERVGLEPP